MATHSSTLAWRMPWSEEPGRWFCTSLCKSALAQVSPSTPSSPHTAWLSGASDGCSWGLLPSTRPLWASETMLSPEVSSLEAKLTLGSLSSLAPRVHHTPAARPSAMHPGRLCSTTTPPQPCSQAWLCITRSARGLLKYTDARAYSEGSPTP